MLREWKRKGEPKSEVEENFYGYLEYRVINLVDAKGNKGGGRAVDAGVV